MAENDLSVVYPPPPSSPVSLLDSHTGSGLVYTLASASPEHLATLTDAASSLQAFSSSVLLRSTWQPSRSARRFSPLTPIMASPLSSPAASISHDVALSLGSDTEGERPLHSESAACTETATLNPTWMSTPPTPLSKYVHKPSTSVTSQLRSSFATASASFPDTAISSVSKASSEVAKKRPSSFPPVSVSKPLPAIPFVTLPPPLEILQDDDDFSRRTGISSRSPLRVTDGEHSDERQRPAYQSAKPSSQTALRAKPSFHLPQDSSDKEDNDELERLSGYSKDSLDGEEFNLAAVSDLPRAKDDLAQDDTRKYHALLELVSTEVGYLLDLKILVNVYLRLLPILTIRQSHSPSSSLGISHFSRSTYSSFTTSSSSNPALRMQSFPRLSTAVPLSPALVFCENMPPIVHPPSVPASKEKDKSSMRRIFSPADIDLVTRNVEDILKFHEQLVYELRALVSSLDFALIPAGAGSIVTGMRKQGAHSLETLGSALHGVALKFIERAPNFDLYQSFCSRHPEAFDLIRKVQREFPAEWDAFEQKCTAMATEMRVNMSLPFGMGREVGDNDAADDTLSKSDLLARRRRHSLSSLHALSHQQSLSRVSSNVNLKSPVLNASESGHSDLERTGRKSKLVFMDYLIKPVQRICRYPLLLDQLQDHPRSVGNSRKPSSASSAESGTHRVEVNVVQSALIAMRAVASSVDEARRRQDLAIKSSLIVSRISQGLALATASHSRPAPRDLSSGFISSLGSCYLAGSLDVIHYHGLNTSSKGTVKAKYLGAFLYAGGYLILAKVHKVRMYEPKHWFSLAGFDLVDSTEDEAILPSWFRLCGRGHIFEFAASCRREKDVWKAAIHHVNELPSAWMGEPFCSFQGDFKGDLAPSLVEDTSYEAISPLPTIQSIPELDIEQLFYEDEKRLLSSPSDPLRSGRITSKVDPFQKSDAGHQIDPSRRSSTISNRACLSTLSESDTIHLVRATAPAREQVDHGLLDVFSDSCLSARCYAHTHEEELFEASKVSRSFSRSSSGLTIASAMSVAAKNRLTKRESVFLPRRKSCVDGVGHYDVSAAHLGPPAKLGKKLKIVAVSKVGCLDGDEGKLEIPLESPSAISQYSSVCTPESIAASPVVGPERSLELSGVSSRPDFAFQKAAFAPKRSHSMIESVQVLLSRSTSPTPTLSREQSESSSGATTQGLLRWWSKGSLRRRVRSAPEVPVDEPPSDATSESIDPSLDSHLSMSSTDRAVSQHSSSVLRYASSSVAGQSGVATSTPVRMRLFGPHSLRRRSTTTTSISLSPAKQEEGSTPRTVRIRRNLSFLSRLSPMTPEAVLRE